MTGLRARLAERLDEIEAGPVLTVVALSPGSGKHARSAVTGGRKMAA